MKRFLITSMLAVTLSTSLGAAAQQLSPVGLWRTVNEVSGKTTSLVRITESAGIYKGTIEKVFREPGENPNPLCKECTGDLKDRPIIGMTILNDIKRDGDDYTGGTIVDPHDGKVYNGKLNVIDGGQKLKLRGFVGLPLFGRTQIWLREQ